jgi:hypothetical protein
MTYRLVACFDGTPAVTQVTVDIEIEPGGEEEAIRSLQTNGLTVPRRLDGTIAFYPGAKLISAALSPIKL